MDRSPRSAADPIVSWLASIDNAFEEFRRRAEGDGMASENYVRLLETCVRKFIDERRYREDIRFIKILVLYVCKGCKTLGVMKFFLSLRLLNF